ncbi:MAG: hypothetical protein OXI57_09070 [Rhodospirillales bacterium]|nr:hypothetical protein [Rhodospirillales bacterium]
MSRPDVQSDIEREFREAKRVAHSYLRSAGVLPPEGKSKQEHEKEKRWSDERNMRAAILRGSSPYGLPIDPDAYNAADLGRRYLHCGRDDEVLDALLERDCSHWAYRLALDWVVCGLLATGADVPLRLRRWDEEPRNAKPRVKRRWRPETVQNHLIGVVVEMMVTGTNVLEHYGEGEKEKEQLQRDLQATSAEAGRPIEELPTDEVLKRVNKRRSRRRGNADARRPLTEDEFVALVQRLSTGVSAGSHMLSPPTDYRPNVEPSFPNLPWVSGEATKDNKHRTYSICDAVAEVLQEELPRRGRSEDRDRPWGRTVERAWRDYRNEPSPHAK